jgi:hypothetical protein
MPVLRPTILALAFTIICARPVPAEWFQGNTHTHTINSDGDSTPDAVVRWYREHGYDFLFITDHGMITNVDPLNALFGGDGQFLVLPGEEVTSNSKSPELHVHVNALGPKSRIAAQKGTKARDTLQMDLDAIASGGGLAQINHPNFFWQLTADDIASVKGARLLEIMNMHPIVNSLGAGPAAPSVEDIWDQVLSRGFVIWGVASDDVHQLKEAGSSTAGTAGQGALPGRGWIVVRAEHLKADEIMAAIEKGDFYASTGVALKDYQANSKQITIQVRTREAYREKYRIQFVGNDGKILQDATADSAVYKIKGDEGYVRARITNSNGQAAWTQPVFTDSRQQP